MFTRLLYTMTLSCLFVVKFLLLSLLRLRLPSACICYRLNISKMGVGHLLAIEGRHHANDIFSFTADNVKLNHNSKRATLDYFQSLSPVSCSASSTLFSSFALPYPELSPKSLKSNYSSDLVLLSFKSPSASTDRYQLAYSSHDHSSSI